MKKFTVLTTGRALKQVEVTKTYSIKAEDEDEAIELGKKQFADSFKVNSKNVHIEFILSNKDFIKRLIFAVVCFAIAITLSSFPWFVGKSNTPITIHPTLKTLVYSLFFVGGTYFRIKDFKDFNYNFFVNLMLLLMNILLFSTFISIFLTPHYLNIFGFEVLKIQTDYILFFAIILAWGGLKSVSLICYFIIAFLSLTNFSIISEAMKIYGIFYFLSSVSFLLANLSIDPQMQGALPFIKNKISKSIDYVKYEARESIDNLENRINH